jgi:hypothetical protein
LHRGLKPSNILLLPPTGEHGTGPDGTAFRSPRVTDFGIAKLFLDTVGSGDSGLGTGLYLVPELAAGKPIGKRSDFYSLGATLYTLFTGHPPFVAQTVVELIHKHCFVLPERPQHYVPDLPDEIDRLVMKLLAKEPGQRPGSGTLLLGELERIWGELERRDEVGRRPVLPALPNDAGPEVQVPPDDYDEGPDSSRQWRWPQGLGRALLLGGLLVAVVGVLVWAFFFRGPGSDELYQKGVELLRSDDPADWERAWRECFEPMSRHYPDLHQREVQQARRLAEDQAELRRGIAAGRLAQRLTRPESEAERFYFKGLGLCHAGDFPEARQIWENLIRAFGVVEKEQRWVRLARIGLDRLKDPKETAATRTGDSRTARDDVAAALARADQLRHAGKTAEADDVSQALEKLYRDDPDPAVRELFRKPPH